MDDRQIDQVLTAALRRRGDANASGAGDGCLDAETLAAWSAGTLSTTDAAAVETHLASCPRCLEMAALFSETTAATTTPAAVVPFRRPWAIRWALPLAAAAAAGLVWFVWPGERPPEPETQLAKTLPDAETRVTSPTPLPESPAMPAPSAAPTLAEKNMKTQGGQAATRSDANKDARDRQATPQERPKLDAIAPAQTQTSAAQPEAARTQPPSRAEAPPKVAGQPVPPPAPVTEPQARGAASPLVTPPPPTMPRATTSLPPPPPSPVPAPAPVGAAPRETFREAVILDPRAVVAEFSTVESDAFLSVADQSRVAAGRGGGGGRGVGRGGGGGGAAAPVQQAAESLALPRWRVLASGAVERSTDAGSSWTPITIDPPVHIINGSSSSRTSGWLIGRGGAVLLSTDGLRFQRVSSPTTSSELTSIRSTSARQATVTTADGRTFVTSDGGANWRETKLP